ncbi:trans-sulfuration enzyme family protein [Thalassiella azotivora]
MTTETPRSNAPAPSLRTRAVHAGRSDLTGLGVHALPIDLSTTNPLPGVETGGASYELLATGGAPGADDSHVYARLWNPTVARFEDALADLEGAHGAVAFGTGMAALSAVLVGLGEAAALTDERARPHVVAVRPLYGGSDHLLATGVLGPQVTFAAAGDLVAALRADTALVVLETPANPTLDLVDVAAVVATVRQRSPRAAVLVDNTFATPVLQRPAALGADLVLHSATKYLGGHGDAMGGVVATAGPRAVEWTARLRRVRAVTGALLHPLGAYLLHRGLPTLPLRVRAQGETAGKVAAALLGHRHVRTVHYPGLTECDPRGLVGRQMDGPGAVLAFEVDGGYDAACRVAAGVRLATHAVSLGGVDTLIQHPAALTHRPVAGDAKPAPGLLRLSVGLEDADDVLADLDRAIRAAHA